MRGKLFWGLIIIPCLTACFFSEACKPKEETSQPDNDFSAESTIEQKEAENMICDLYCLTDTEEIAKAIAAEYNITFLVWTDGVAQFCNTSGKTYGELYKMGQENNWPVLSQNRVVSVNGE